ncbi:hypothetical protein RN001_008134 [Aquatica leii]|uniref:Uncharacterized protein n=1 Tax=Aquatica leii TaxID=1421715 RepID=A0AAN7SP53_9COLE|nr:hypothetical protein RN001_008134 [Aquatica leii]
MKSLLRVYQTKNFATLYQAEASATITNLVLHFPVRAHSYLPTDQVFDRAEKILKKHTIMVSTEEYKRFYEQVGQVRTLSTDWNLYDIKNLSTTYNKITGIKDLKIIYLQKSISNSGITVKFKGIPF